QAHPILRDDQRYTAMRGSQRLQQSHGVWRTRRASDPNDDRWRSVHLKSLSVNTNPRKTMLITPFMVKNAASRREKSSALTSECSYNSNSAATSAPTKYSAPAPAPIPAKARPATVVR